MMRWPGSLSPLLILLACLTPGLAHAQACSNPAGNEGDIFYNQAYHTPQFCNGSNWIAMGAAGGSGGPVLISTQTASASASLQFTSLPTSYNTLFLNCEGLTMTSAGGTVQVYVGEGAGPTWETGAHYSSSNDGKTNATDYFDGAASWYNTTLPVSLKFWIDNPGSSSVVKVITTYISGAYNNSAWGEDLMYAGWWNSDTNALTGFELVGNGSTIKAGTCSLYGMN